VHAPTHLFALLDEQLGVTANVGIFVTIDDEACFKACLSELTPSRYIAPLYLLQVNEHGRIGQRVHLLAVLIDDFQLSVVFIHEGEFRHAFS
jgi:hypothetical protein